MEYRLPFSVKMTLKQNDHVISEHVAETDNDLRYPVEMDTGVGWVEVEELYLRMANRNTDYQTETFKVCNSFEKWGAWQQEVVYIKVTLHRLTKDETEVRVDDRGEWFREWDSYSNYINHPPRWYWIGMVLSALWIVVYLLIYPSIPLMNTHWQGLGVPGGCTPWTVICEMQQDEAALNQVRGVYLDRIRLSSVDELLADSEMSEFISRAGRVLFADNCSACHGKEGKGISKIPEMAPVLTDSSWLHGADVKAIQACIRNPMVHPYALAKPVEEVNTKILALYVYLLRH